MKDLGIAAAFAPNSITKVSVDGRDYVVVHNDNGLYVADGLCPHRGAPLEGAQIVGDRLVCSWHRTSFCLDTGDACHGPGKRGLRRYDCHERNGKLYANLSEEVSQ